MGGGRQQAHLGHTGDEIALTVIVAALGQHRQRTDVSDAVHLRLHHADGVGAAIEQRVIGAGPTRHQGVTILALELVKHNGKGRMACRRRGEHHADDRKSNRDNPNRNRCIFILMTFS